jgi:pyruvate dehydrogenase E2 component (dihydrolipoyllysine-residue acetyltransferase)
MSINIEMPKLSDTMTEGTLLKWLKKVGDSVEVGDVIAEVETDKATMEMEAFDEGVLSEIFVQEGQKVEVGQKLAILTEPGEKKPTKTEAKPSGKVKTTEAAPQTEAKKETPRPAPVEEKRPAPKAEEEEEEEKEEQPSGEATERAKVSPLARKIAKELGVDLSGLEGSGPGNRIVRDDVLAAAQGASKAVKARTEPVAALKEAGGAPITAPAAEDKQMPLSGMRKTIAARLLESKTTIPHFYLQAEIDTEPLTRLRKEINVEAESAGRPKVTVNDFILKATAVAASRVPLANAAFQGESILQHGRVQLACAVAIEEGLVTPVIRDADKKSLSEISAAIKDLATRARSKKLKPEEYQGGTITVSNLGGYGVEHFFAIINPPQSVIVSVGAIVKKAVVNATGQIVAGERMMLGLSCDHRVVDGAVGAKFLAELKKLLENPPLMLI